METTKSLKELIRTIKEMTYQWQFNTIIKLINDNVPQFFGFNGNILYILMKFILIDKLRSGAQSDAEEFYNEYLVQILKQTHPNNFEEKNQLFSNLIHNPNLCADNSNIALRYMVDLKQQAYFERFHLIVERLLLGNEQGNNESGLIDYFSDYEKEYCALDNCTIESSNMTTTQSTSSTVSTTSNTSTMSLGITNMNIGSSTIPLFTVDNGHVINKKTFITHTSHRSTSKLFVVRKTHSNSNTKPLKVNSSKSKTYSSEVIKTQKSNQPSSTSSCSEQYFHPKYSRRVNICKKICRKFKKYLKSRSDLLVNPFWLQFVKDKLLPPFRLEEEKVEFKSFSHNYLNWLFNHEGAIELYQAFINDRSDRELKAIYDEYQIEDIEERKSLEKYFKEFCIIFNKEKTINYEYVQSHLANLQMIDKAHSNGNGNNNTFNSNEHDYIFDYEDDDDDNDDDDEQEMKKDELFDGLIKELCKDEKNKRKRRTQYERSRETNYNVFDNMIKSESNSSSDKEE